MKSRRTERFEAFELSGHAQKIGRRGPRGGTTDLRRVGARVKDWNLAVWAARYQTPLVRPFFFLPASVSVMRSGSSFPSALRLSQTSSEVASRVQS